MAQEQAWEPASLREWASSWELEPELQAQQGSPARHFWGLPERALPQARGLPWEPLPQARGLPWEPLPLAQEQAWEPVLL